MTQIRLAATVALVGIGLVIAGYFNPWVVGHGVSKTGQDIDGHLLLFPVVLGGIFTVATVTRPAVARISRWFVLPLAILTLGMAIDHLRSAWVAELDPVQGPPLPLDMRFGIWLVVAGAVMLLGASLAMLVTRVPRPSRHISPTTSDEPTTVKVVP